MIVRVSQVRHVWIVHEATFQEADAVLELLVRVVRKAKLVKNLRVSIIMLQGLGQVRDGLVKQVLIVEALGAMRQEFGVLRAVLDGLLVVLNSPMVVAESVVSSTKAILDAPVVLQKQAHLVERVFLRLGRLEVFDGFVVVLLRVLAEATTEVAVSLSRQRGAPLLRIAGLFGWRKGSRVGYRLTIGTQLNLLGLFRILILKLVVLDGLVKVVNGHLMVTHVVVDAAARNEHSLVVLHFLEHLGEAFERLTELADPMVHETQMESAGCE